jgi:5-methylcytosine-specific restriction endonuclease McrA
MSERDDPGPKRKPGRPALYTEAERREKRRLKFRKWRKANLERAREITRNCEKRRAAARALAEGREPGRIGRPAQFSEKEKRAKQNARVKDYYRRHPQKLRAYAAGRERKKRKAIKEGQYFPVPIELRKLSPEQRKLQARVMTHKRRARELASGGTHSADDIAILRDRQKGKCVFCLEPFGEIEPHVDHHVPLVLGGSNDIGNLRLLHPRCNLMKAAKHPIEHALANGLLCW